MLTTPFDQGLRQEADWLKYPERKEASIIQKTNMCDEKENMFQCHSPKSSPTSLSHRVPKTVLYICVSFAVSHTGLSLPSFKFRIYALVYCIGVFLSGLLHCVYYHIRNASPVQVGCRIQEAWGWCTGMTQRDGMGREEGRGFRMGNMCTSVVDSCWCMAKPIQYCKVISLQLK